MPENPEELISIARIARPQGIRGEVIADLLTDFPDRFSRLKIALVKKPNGELVRLQLENSRPHKGRILLKFAGYNDMNAAENLRDARVMITADELVKLPADNYYEFDLIDCAVITTNGQAVGTVTGVQHCGAAPLLVVSDNKREHLIPMASGICLEIDTAQKRIVVDPPEGLLDL